MIDKIYKIGLLLLGIIFLILFYQYNQKNRYQLNVRDNNVFDTNSGHIYHLSVENKEWLLEDPLHGDRTKIPLKECK